MSLEFWSIVGTGIGLATLFVIYSQFILGRIDKVNETLNSKIDTVNEHLSTEISDLKQAIGELRGRVDELSGFVRALLPPRAA